MIMRRTRIKHLAALREHEAYTISDKPRKLVTLVSQEECKVEKGKIYQIGIIPVEIPKNSMLNFCMYARHPVGNVVSVVENPPKRIEELREVGACVFISWDNGLIENEDVLGVIGIVPLERLDG